MALLVVVAVALGFCAHPKRHTPIPEQVLLFPDDKPLMTEQEKEWARQSGTASYMWDGMNVVDERVPEAYWTPQWHE